MGKQQKKKIARDVSGFLRLIIAHKTVEEREEKVCARMVKLKRILFLISSKNFSRRRDREIFLARFSYCCANELFFCFWLRYFHYFLIIFLSLFIYAKFNRQREFTERSSMFESVCCGYL